MNKNLLKIPYDYELKLPIQFIINSSNESLTNKDILNNIISLFKFDNTFILHNDIETPISQILHSNKGDENFVGSELEFRIENSILDLKNNNLIDASVDTLKLTEKGLHNANKLTREGVLNEYIDRINNLELSSPEFSEQNIEIDNKDTSDDKNLLSQHFSPFNKEYDADNSEDYRDKIIKYLNRHLYGPNHLEPLDNDILNEELQPKPNAIYGTGILFNESDISKSYNQNIKEDEEELIIEDSDIEYSEENESEINLNSFNDENLKADWNDEVALSNNNRQSSCGISFSADKTSELIVTVNFGTYDQEKRLVENYIKQEEKEDLIKSFHVRKQHEEKITINLNSHDEKFSRFKIRNSNELLELRSEISQSKNPSSKNITLFIRNTALIKDWRNNFYQVSLSIEDKNGEAIFFPIVSKVYSGEISEDEKLDFLYRNNRTYARGHGVSADWEVEKNNKKAKRIFTQFLPRYEIKPIEPRKKPFSNKNKFNLKFYELSKFENKDFILKSLLNFSNDYYEWINKEKENFESDQDSENKRFSQIAYENLSECKKTFERMKEGIEILSSDELSFKAFCYMNESMMMQQWHSSLKNKKKEELVEKHNDSYDIEGKAREWYPFQLAFILINIRGICHQKDRDLVDLIWFPTGGGKTEAYLGLTAFTICYKKLKNPQNGGTISLMRYTLRLLTSQQLLRAIPLIMSLEKIRQRDKHSLGDIKIDIGLWVGRDTTPNRREDAISNLSDLRKSNFNQNKLQILNCPWCKTDFVERDDKKQKHHCPGYTTESIGNGNMTVVFKCPDSACDYYNEILPIKVVDEDLYDNPPTFLIGTVDKFAQLAWNENTKSLFGINKSFDPPELIIQDELHLISGPLGSVVGHYEAVLDILCMNEDGVLPKIIASTATIRQSKDQIKLLYNRGLNQFPPQAITFGNTYFAEENDKKYGRFYFGFYPSALSSNRLAEQQVIALLLQKSVIPYKDNIVYEDGELTPKFEEGFNLKNVKTYIDPYTTVVWYFNTLRDLGYNATNLQDGVRSEIRNLKALYKLPSILHRQTQNVELTSRLPSYEIPNILKRLDSIWSPRPLFEDYADNEMPLDIVFSTNMISVGVDIDRLGLMLINGQPNNSSEYIQASSRVGRKYPGLVFTLYGKGRSRDKSIYENFRDFHQSIYKNVESSGLTPFTKKVRDRALPALILILARLKLNIKKPNEISEKDVEKLKELLRNYYNRILDITGSDKEQKEAEDEGDKFIDDWIRNKNNFKEWGKNYGEYSEDQFMYSFGETLVDEDNQFLDKSQVNGYPILNSMRNVDTTCQGRVVSSVINRKVRE